MKYTRKAKDLKPRKIFIFTEGSVTEQIYFKKFIDYFKISQASVQVIDRASSKSSPKAVLDYVIEFEQQRKQLEPVLYKRYEYWLVIDYDKWGTNLITSIKKAERRNYYIALSRPCFEIWFLLHYRNAQSIIQDQTNLCSKREINKAIQTHNPSRSYEKNYFEKTDFATQNAEDLDIDPDQRILQSIGTRVYRLVKIISEYK